MSLTLCCLLSRTYDAWRTESCQKHLQRLLLDLIERWVLWMCSEKIENREDFEVWYINAIATTTSFAFNHSSSSNSFISIRIESRENKRYRRYRLTQIQISLSSISCQSSDENCRLYEIRLSILKAADSRIIKSCFFWVTYEDDFQIFNADWLEIEKNDSRCEDHNHNDSSSHRISECEDRDHNDSSSLMNTAYEHKSIRLQQLIEFRIISRNFDAKKRTRVRN